jgi:hypothetical protein
MASGDLRGMGETIVGKTTFDDWLESHDHQNLLQ